MGLSSTTDKQKEAAWRVEFDALGEQLVFENVRQGAIYNDEAKRQAALRWHSEHAASYSDLVGSARETAKPPVMP